MHKKVVCPECLGVNRLPFDRVLKKAKCGKCSYNLLQSNSITLTQKNFDEIVVNEERLVVVDFWAPWCGPCKMMAPVFEEVSKSFGIEVCFAKLNTEQEPSLAARFGIRSIPTCLVFLNGKVLGSQSGALTKEQLESFVKQYS